MRKLNFLIVLFFYIFYGYGQKKINSPNFILFLADDQGWNGTSVKMMNSEPLSKSDFHTTPNLHELASKSIRFSDAYAAAPVCAPSRYSIQFGKTPARLSLIRVGMNSDHIPHEKFKSIPKALKEVDDSYVTAHFGKWGIGGSPKILGYDYSDGTTKNKDGGFVNNKDQWINTVMDDPKKIFSLTEKATQFMENNVHNNTPFFLQVSHYAVHASLQMRDESLKKFQNKEKGQFQKNSGFAAMTLDLDEGLGILLQKVKDLGIEDNTYIIYMSDNGSVPNIPGAKKYTHSYNYPLSRGKWDAMEGGIRVPLIISGPGINSSKEVNTPVSGSDLLPTITDLAGQNKVIFDDIDGGSLKNIILGEDKNLVEREVDGIFFHVPYKNGIALKRPHSAIRRGDYKLIKFQDSGEILLFNMIDDIKEENNLLANNKKIAKNLENILDNYLDEVDAPKWQEGINWKNKPLKEFNSHH
mgnify:FL=1